MRCVMYNDNIIKTSKVIHSICHTCAQVFVLEGERGVDSESRSGFYQYAGAVFPSALQHIAILSLFRVNST